MDMQGIGRMVLIIYSTPGFQQTYNNNMYILTNTLVALELLAQNVHYNKKINIK